jgi:hypothetical protein
MDLNTKSNEYYVDGKDKWAVHYVTAQDYRGNQGDYTEVIQVFKNHDLVGQTTSRKDKGGNSLTKAYQEGLYIIPVTAKAITAKS